MKRGDRFCKAPQYSCTLYHQHRTGCLLFGSTSQAKLRYRYITELSKWSWMFICLSQSIVLMFVSPEVNWYLGTENAAGYGHWLGISQIKGSCVSEKESALTPHIGANMRDLDFGLSPPAAGESCGTCLDSTLKISCLNKTSKGFVMARSL